MADDRRDLPEPIADMFDEEGRVSGLAIAAALGETSDAIARAFGVDPQVMLSNPVAELIQVPGRRLAGILAELSHYFSNDFASAVAWMRKPHPQLDNLSPLDMIKEGDMQTVAGMVRMIGTGEPG
jgi:Protein of unknown function (DUF2384)